MGDKTTIWISRETKKRLDEIGRKGDTYEDIIKRLLEVYEKYKKEKLKVIA